MLLLDVFVRYSTVTLLFLIAILAIRDARGFRPMPYVVLTCLTVAFMLLGTARPEYHLPQPFHAMIRFLDFANIVFIWWLGLSMFQDDFRLRWPHWAVFATNFIILIPKRYWEVKGLASIPATANYALDVIMFGIMGHLVFVILKGRADDLVEPRRRARVYFVMAMVAATLTAIIAENLLAQNYNNELSIFRCMIILPLALWGVLWLTQLHPEKFAFEKPKPQIVDGPAIDPRDQRLLEHLTTAMETDHIYKEPGLTIRSLSEKLKTPEHRLRVLINQGLGYRNFSAFVNSYRIDAVKAAFAAPENSRIPVLTIAMDVGFNSLAPFNRAFRDIEGMTPSAYRQTITANPD